ncbi:MAG: nicotinate-nucleotide adenylyltransferase [Thermoanaerobaculaceae bacterium]
MKRVGFFGGTFDPVHLGHLVPAVRAFETFRFDALVFVPAAQPPHKVGDPMTPFSHRFAMLALATQPYDRFLVSPIEAERTGPTYTVDTLRLLRGRFAVEQMFFLMGSDSFSQIATWSRWEELVDLAHLVVLHRGTAWGEELNVKVPACLRPRMRTVEPFLGVADPVDASRSIYLLAHEPFPISATDLRERLRLGLTIHGLVPPEVHRYIVKHRLYDQWSEPVDAG